MTHYDLKLHPAPFEAKHQGLKSWELRSTADRTFRVDDTVSFQEWDPEAEVFTGGELGPFRITYVLPYSHTWGLQPNHCIFSHT